MIARLHISQNLKLTKLYRASCAAFIVVVILLVHSQPATSSPKYSAGLWPLSQQLTQETILSVLQAHDGTLWIATLAGVIRFDGTRLVTYKPRAETKGSIASSNILELLETSDHRIVVATKDAGLLLFDKNSMKFLLP